MPAGCSAGDAGDSGSAVDEGLPTRFRPLGVRIAAIGFAVALLVTLAGVWIALPEEGRAAFTLLQRLTVLIMVAGALAICHALARCRVDADEAGLTVVNGYRSRRLDWGQIVAVSLRPGSPWVMLDLNDGTTHSAMGIQGSDGLRARRQTRRLKELVAAHAAPEPGPGL